MHISLTPELENLVKEKVASGLYNNASEVVREALRFMTMNEELIYRMKLDALRVKLLEGERDISAGRYQELSAEDLNPLFRTIKNNAQDRIQKESQ